MSLAPGHKLAHYEILEPIGKGGMGEVYRARDTKLGRDVAIKVLPEAFAGDDERLARFEREAKLLAALNHPNIASIYGLEDADDVKALVLELVEGRTLAERIQEGPIPVEEAIAIGRQIAEALEAGHEAGVIHRDLKPANVKVKEDGTVKVLDYGLAKALEGDTPSGSASELSQSPTLTRQGTQIGVILGTAAYMSPEQAKGQRVDKRTDIWAFGAVVYEMLTGKRAFGGEDVSDTLAAVLRTEPDFDALPADTPSALRRTLELCLTKDLKQRFQAVGDVRLALEGAFETRAEGEPRDARTGRPWLVATLAALAGLLAGLGIQSLLSREPPRAPTRLTLSTASAVRTRSRAVAVSRDGKRIAYATQDRIWLHDLRDFEARPVAGTEGASNPFFSTDAEWLGFSVGRELRKVSVNGGLPLPVAAMERGFLVGGWWHDDGSIVFADRSGVMRVADTGGEPENLVPASPTVRFLSNPQILPRGRAVLYTETSGGESRVVAYSLLEEDPRVLVNAARAGRYLPTGHLVYFQAGTLFAARFDPDRLVLEGSPVPLVEGVRPIFGVSAHFDVSDTGTLVYLRGGVAPERRLVWVDREGREETLPLEAANYAVLQLSPDGTRLAFDTRREENPDLWLYDFSTGTLSRFTFDPADDSDPVWSTDGARIYFSSTRGGGPKNVYWKPSDGSGDVARVTESESTQWPQFVTPDGSVLVIDESTGEQGTNILQLVLNASAEPQPYLRTRETERLPSISPNGRFVAYELMESGVRNIFVRTFPEGGGPWQISNRGGRSPQWSPDGRELFFLDQGALMAVTVETEPAFRVTGTRTLFEGPYVDQSRSFAVSRDGERFLMIKESDASATDGGSDLAVVLDWFEEVKRLVPTDN